MLQPILLQLLSLFHTLLSYLPVSISSHVYAALFALHIGLDLKLSAPHETRTTTLSISGRDLETHVITTKSIHSSPKTRTILVVHGLAATAHNDPRVIRLAHAIATAQPHAIVLVPHIPPLALCDLDDEPVQLIEDIIRVISADGNLCPMGRLSIASACISAGFSIVAAAQANDVVHSIYSIGSHASVNNVLDHCVKMKGKGDARYPIHATLGSFSKPRGPLREFLVAYVFDDHYRNIGRASNELDHVMAQYPEETKEYNRLWEDFDYLHSKLLQMFDDNGELFSFMSPTTHVDKLKCQSIALIHAGTDDVVPNTESLVLHEALEKNNKTVSKLCVTPLLNHGDQRALGLADAPLIFKFISASAIFFEPDYSLDNKKKKVA